MYTDGKWKNLYACHLVDELYNYWLNELLLKYKDKLNKIAPLGDWYEDKETSKRFLLIVKYDRDSSYFRYPVTKNTHLDSKKNTMQKIKSDKLETIFNSVDKKKEKKWARLISLIVNNNDEIVNGFELDKNVLGNVNVALQEIGQYFHAIHTMTRFTICNGT